MVEATPRFCAAAGVCAVVAPSARLAAAAGTDWSDGAVGPGAGFAANGPAPAALEGAAPAALDGPALAPPNGPAPAPLEGPAPAPLEGPAPAPLEGPAPAALGGAAAPPAAPAAASRCPQCWQKAKPDGVCLPQDGHVDLPGAAAGAASALGLGAASEVPHILQKFIPVGLVVPQALQTTPAAGAGLGAGGASSRWPQSWQNSDPSRFTFPQCEQRGIARLTSRV
jgi:hypothetical protein